MYMPQHTSDQHLGAWEQEAAVWGKNLTTIIEMFNQWLGYKHTQNQTCSESLIFFLRFLARSHALS